MKLIILNQNSESYNDFAPDTMLKSDSTKMEIIYDATGTKWQQKEYDTSGGLLKRRSYIAGFEFLNGDLELVHHPQGYIKNVQAANNESVWLHGVGTTEQAQTITSDQNIASHQNITYTAAQTITLKPGFHAKAGSDFLAHIAPINTAPQYEWQYTLSDHLGNTRVLFADKNNDGQINSETEILQQLDYFPFGMEKQWASVATDPTRYTYNGKEHDGFSGLQFYGARNYDCTVGRFTGVDPISDKFPHVSVFNYAENEPISNIDLHGLQKVFFQEALKENQTFQDAYEISKNTPGGKRFQDALKSQNSTDVLFVTGGLGAPDGFTTPIISSEKEVIPAVKSLTHLNNAVAAERGTGKNSIIEMLNGNKADEKNTIVIGINPDCLKDCSDLNIIETAATISHEQDAHAKFLLQENPKSNAEGHGYYYGQESETSPTSKEVKNIQKYHNTPAYKDLKSIENQLRKNNE